MIVGSNYSGKQPRAETLSRNRKGVPVSTPFPPLSYFIYSNLSVDRLLVTPVSDGHRWNGHRPRSVHHHRHHRSSVHHRWAHSHDHLRRDSSAHYANPRRSSAHLEIRHNSALIAEHYSSDQRAVHYSWARCCAERSGNCPAGNLKAAARSVAAYPTAGAMMIRDRNWSDMNCYLAAVRRSEPYDSNSCCCSAVTTTVRSMALLKRRCAMVA